MTTTRHDLSKLSIDRSSAPRRGPSWVTWLILVLLLAAVGWMAWERFGADLVDPRPAVQLTRAQRVGGAAGKSGTAANGYVVARRRAALSTDVQGRLVEIRVEEGTHVAEGDLIARLDTAQLEAQLARTEAQIARGEADLDYARKDYERLTKLQVPVDVSQSRVDQSEATLNARIADVAAFSASHREIEILIEKASVYAPFDGVIVEKNAEVGEVVSSISASGANARGAVATIVDFATLEVQVELAQTSLRAARQEAAVLIYLDAFPERAYRGVVRQIWPTADRSKATVELRVNFLERDDRILPEMGVRVVFVEEDDAEPSEPEVFVLTSAVVGAGGEQPFVFLFTGGAVMRRPITLGPIDGGRAQVLDGLQGNELIVLDPPEGLVDGAEVRAAEDGGAR